MLYQYLAAFVGTYSVLAIVLLIVQMYLVSTRGYAGFGETINKLAKSKNIVAFEIYSYVTLVGWLLLALPWIDLFTFGKFSHFDRNTDNVVLWFGTMDHWQASFYFFLVLVNILGVKAALLLAELSGMLRRGRVRVFKYGWLVVFKPE